MKNLLLCTIALVVLCSCEPIQQHLVAGSGMNWVTFRGNRALSGYTAQSLPDDLSLLWNYHSSVRSISSPVVMEGTAYWSDVKGKIYGVNLQGEEVFSFDMKTPVEAPPMVFDSMLYIGRVDGGLTALSLRERDTLWTHYTEGQISASPNLTDKKDGVVVVGSYDNFMYSIDRNTGERINRYEAGYYINGAVAIHDRHAIYGSCDGWLRIVNCEQGITTDSLELGGYIPSSPAVISDYAYISDYSGNIYELRIEDGKIKTTRTMHQAESESGEGAAVAVPAASNTTLYILLSDNYLHAIDRKSTNLKWKYLLKGTVGESSPIVAADKVVVCTRTGIVTVLDAKSGELVWEYDTGEQIVSSPAAIRGYLFVLTTKGTLFCFGKKKDK